MQNFRNLKVWEKAHTLPLDVYQSSRSFPRDEIYSLTSQIRRASVSIGANIAEGSCRSGDADFARFLQMAAGSASEVEYHLLLAHDLEG
jgi:four helix bundle protein